MAKLSTNARHNLPSADFAGPKRSFPIEDESHARFALAMAHDAPDPSAIRSKVAKKFPSIKQEAVRRALK